MTDLDRLLLLEKDRALNQNVGKVYEEEYESLKAKIEGKIENQITYEKTDFKCDICGKLHGIYQPITKLESQVTKLKEELEVWKNNFDNAFEVMQGFKSTLDEIINNLTAKENICKTCQRNRESILAKHEDKK